MATHNHTPGPWHNGGEGRSIGRDEEMTFLFAATQKGVTKKEKLANVRLACAAPDLLAAAEAAQVIVTALCNWIVDDPSAQHYMGCDPDSDQGCTCPVSMAADVHEALSAAIAKAKKVK